MDMDQILDSLDRMISEWEQQSLMAIEAEANFKSFEASSKKALIDVGDSAAKAEVFVRAMPAWTEKYKALQQASLSVEVLKKRIMVAQLSFDAERTNRADKRRIV